MDLDDGGRQVPSREPRSGVGVMAGEAVTTGPGRVSERRALPMLAVALAASSIGMITFTLVVAASNGELSRVFGPSVLLAGAMSVVGGLIAYRRPHLRVGWLLLFIGVTQALVQFAGAYALLARQSAVGLPAPDVFAWITTWMWMPGLGCLLTFLFLLFPDGHLPSPRWRWLAWLSATVLVIAIGAVAISSWPLREAILHHAGEHHGGGPPPGSLADRVFGPAVLILGACALASMLSLVFRYRRATADVRHQLKWFAYGAAYDVAVSGPLDFIHLQGPTATVGVILQGVGVIGLATAIGVAIFRYHLYDIDIEPWSTARWQRSSARSTSASWWG
jgi:hypothetical protein